MKISELLFENALKSDFPGAASGVQIMSLQQFVQDEQELDEAEKFLGAPRRDYPEDELTDYLRRKLSPELQKKYRRPSKKQLGKMSGEEYDIYKRFKQDKLIRPYIHSGTVPIVDGNNQLYDLPKLMASVMQRPKKLLKQNEKMQHSDGSSSIFFNIGLPALVGLAVDEDRQKFVVVNTCPGAGKCVQVCYAMKGGYVQYAPPSEAGSRSLNFLLNDPDGWKAMLESEIESAREKYQKKGTQVIIRWHDAGDFFSPEYLNLAYDVARKFPDVQFYAYTKMGDVATSQRPQNFRINFSMGAKSGEYKKVDIYKKQTGQEVKRSEIVDREMFTDLMGRDANNKLRWKNAEAWETFKQRAAQKYGIKPNTIITYDQMMTFKDGVKSNGEPYWNVVVVPGDGDDSANRNDVIITLLLEH